MYLQPKRQTGLKWLKIKRETIKKEPQQDKCTQSFCRLMKGLRLTTPEDGKQIKNRAEPGCKGI